MSAATTPPPPRVLAADKPAATWAGDRSLWIERYREVREMTRRITEPLRTEDFVLQTMPDVSPTKWHLGHTSWFFEQFLLVDGPAAEANYRPFHPQFAYIFNSYYVSVGDRHCRNKRGTLSRPTVEEVVAYRAHVDKHVERLIADTGESAFADMVPLLEIGLNHEQQHQELMLTDIKHVFASNPLYPAYQEAPPAAGSTNTGRGQPRFLRFEEGLREVGHAGGVFAYDNEGPRHKVYLRSFEIADWLVTNGEFLEFMEDGGYENVPLWLSAGASAVAGDPKGWSQPYYWHRERPGWFEFTLSGLRELNPDEPVCHLSYYEADAFARWRGCRLPTEFEWEVACREQGCDPAGGSFLEDGFFHPSVQPTSLFGSLWQWTASQYTPYPGFKPPAGSLGEYNGKFMCNQFVLRGGSCVTPRSHIRATYRNFFPPEARWQFSGLRLARDA